jgi:hypothetical protein
MTSTGKAKGIGQLNEGPLHAALKDYLAQPGDQFEIKVDGYVIDIVRADLLIEIQTANFSGLKRKLHKLTATHKVRLVHPIAAEKWIVRLPRSDESKISRRKSPKRGQVTDIFIELVSFPELVQNPNFSLEVLLIQEDEVRRFKGKPHWRRRGWVTDERRFLGVVKRATFDNPADFAALIPPSVPSEFTTTDLAQGLDRPRWLAQKMAYCLRGMGVIEKIGTRNRSNLYQSVEGF